MWLTVLDFELFTSVVRVVWAAAAYTADVQLRVVGVTHRVTVDDWAVEWSTAPATSTSTAYTFHAGPHVNDRLDAGLVLA
jgi:hypothetical protein